MGWFIFYLLLCVSQVIILNLEIFMSMLVAFFLCVLTMMTVPSRNVFDPRQMCISVRGSGVYINRERGYRWWKKVGSLLIETCILLDPFSFSIYSWWSTVESCSIDPIYIDDPLFPTNNVGRNCFRIHQCIKVSSNL